MRTALLISSLAWLAAATAQLLGDDVECGILNEGDVANSDQTVICGPEQKTTFSSA